MEGTYKFLSDYIKEKLPEQLALLESADTPLPMPKKIVFGVADISRYEQKQLIVITPSSLTEEEGTVADFEQSQSFVVGIACKGMQYDVLVRQMCRYATAMLKILRKGWNLNGNSSDIKIGKTDFFPDAGTTEKQATVAEIEIEIETFADDSESEEVFE